MKLRSFEFTFHAKSKPTAAVCMAILLLAAVLSVFTSDLFNVFPLRTVVGFVSTMFLPGFLILGLFRGTELRPSAKCIYSIALSYIVITFWCVATTLLETNLSSSYRAFLGFSGLVAVTAFLRKSSYVKVQVTTKDLILVAIIGIAVLVGWNLEPAVEGEEIVELISINRIMQNENIRLDNLMHRPETLPSYLFLPYCFLIALSAKISGLSMFAIYAKIRSVYCGISFLVFYLLCAHATRNRKVALLFLMGLLALTFVDTGPLSWPASLLPLNRRGAFSGGVLLPILCLLSLNFFFKFQARRMSQIAVIAALTVCTFFTHALEAVYYLLFLGTAVIVSFIIPDWRDLRRSAFVLTGAVVLTTLLYLKIHGHMVPHITEYHDAHKANQVAELKLVSREPIQKGFLELPETSKYLIAEVGSVTFYSTLGLAGVPLVVLATPVMGVYFLFLTLVALAIFSIPVIWYLFSYFTTPDIFFASAYLAPLGLILFEIEILILAALIVEWTAKRWPANYRMIAFSLGITGILSSYFLIGPFFAFLLGGLTKFPQGLFLWILLGSAVCWWKRKKIPPFAYTLKDPALMAATAVVFLSIFIPLVFMLKDVSKHWNGPRFSLLEKIRQQSEIPSVFNWASYYPVVQQTARPPFDIPLDVLAGLSTVIKAQSTVIYDPTYSYSLPMFLNVYIVNPGHVLSSDMEYFNRYVTKDSSNLPVHPLYNDSVELTAAEIEFLTKFKVEYVITNPRFHDRIKAKLGKTKDGFELIYEKNGYGVFVVKRKFKDA